MFKDIKIKTRLVLVLVFLAIQLIVGAVIGIGNLAIGNSAMRSLYADRVVPLAQLDKVIRLLDTNQLNLTMALGAEPQDAQALLKNVDANIAEISRLWSMYMATSLTPEEEKLAASFTEDRRKLLDSGIRPALQALRSGNAEAAADIVNGPLKSLIGPVRRGADDLIELQLSVAQQEFAANEARYILVRNLCIAGIAVALLITALVGYLLVRAIVPPLEKAVAFAEAVAGGDLSGHVDIRSNDEIGRLLKALDGMNHGLVNIVSQVRNGSESIATASGQIAAGNLDLSSRTEQQASALEETASSMEELTSTVRQNADNAQQANTLAVSASAVAVEGGNVVTDVVKTMASISASSMKIVDIIGVIDSIAFQTNILALNAAVEAARAGEQGRGFAVVASEVRNLAQRSANAAKEVKQLIGDSVDKVEQGSKLVNAAGSTMLEIVERVKRVTDIMGEITAASKEQTDGIEQINQAIAEMEDVTQQNAALVEEAAAASHSLEGQTAQLAELVSVFRLGGEGKVAGPAGRTADVATAPLAGPGKPRVAPARKRLRIDHSKAA